MIEQNKTAASESSTNLAWNKPRARPFGSGHCLWDPSRKWRVWTLLLCWPSRGGPSQAHWLGQWVLTGSTWYVVREIQARGQGFSPSALSAVWAKWLLFVEAVLCVVGCLAEFLGTRSHPSPCPIFTIKSVSTHFTPCWEPLQQESSRQSLALFQKGFPVDIEKKSYILVCPEGSPSRKWKPILISHFRVAFSTKARNALW